VPPASPLLPPDVEVRSYCTSHAVYLRVLNGAISRRGVPPHARSSVADSAAPSDYSHATSDRESQLVILVLICVFSLIILAFGNRFMNISLALILFIGCFLLIFGAVDAIAFRERSPFTYVPCALPLVLGVFFGVVLAMLALCILQKFVWLAFFLLGASLGTTVMFILRLGILNFHEDFIEDPNFGWFWLATALVACAVGLAAARLKGVVYTITTLVVGGYGVALSISGMVVVAGASPIGFGAFLILLLTASAGGACVQWLLSRQVAQPDSSASNTSEKDLGKDGQVTDEGALIGT